MRSLVIAMLSLAFVSALSAQDAAPPSGPPPAAGATSAQTCVPDCRRGFLCHAGQCVSMCNPPCAQSELCLASGECAAAAPAPAPAAPVMSYEQPPIPERSDEEVEGSRGAIDHSVFVSFGLTLFAYETASLSADDFPGTSDATLISVGTFGTPKLTIGYAFTNELMIGGELSLLHRSSDTESDFGQASSNETRFGIGPSFTYIAPGEAARFFIAGRAGVRYGSTSGDLTTLTFPVGASLGVHLFASDDLSIAPSAFFNFAAGSMSGSGGDASATGFDLGLGLELAGWL